MKTILAIDGGGVRGLMEAMILRDIEKTIRAYEKYKVNLAYYFDVISGASTGGILAGILTCPDDRGNYKYDCSDAVTFYEKNCYDIFNKSKRMFGALTHKYSEKNLEKYLKKYFGDVKLKDLKNHVIIPTVDLNTSEAVFFSNIKKDDKYKNILVRDVLRFTSAAPTYFKPHTANGIIGIDGGMVANNTSMCCIAKVRKYEKPKPRLKNIALLNISSGSVKPNIKNLDTWNLLKWATNITNIMLYSNVGLVKYQTNTVQLGKNFNIDIPEKYRLYSQDMADASKKNMRLLVQAANNTISDYEDYIDKTAQFLIKNKKIL